MKAMPQQPLLAMLLGAAWVAALPCCPPAHAADAAPQAVELAPGAFHLQGEHAPWGDQGRTRVANAGFVVGTRCVAVIDSGGSPADGRALLAAVRRVSALPVCYVINTHVHPDHLLGNAAFAQANAGGTAPRFVGHARLAAALAAREPHYRRAFARDVGAAQGGLERMAPPDVAVQEMQPLDLGARVLELRAWPTAHTDNDLTVLDRASGTLWLGDLVFEGHLPVLDGKLAGWLQVLDALAGVHATRAVPGHGRVFEDWPAVLQPTRRYLQQLRDDVNAALDDGTSLSQAVERLGRAPEGWLLGEAFHRRNVTAAYAELEWSR